MSLSPEVLASVLDVMTRLRTYEAQFGLPSEEFYARFWEGEFGDQYAYLDWASAWEQYHVYRDLPEWWRLRAAQTRPVTANLEGAQLSPLFPIH